MKKLLRRLLGKTETPQDDIVNSKRDFEDLMAAIKEFGSTGELQHIKEEADYLSAAIDTAKGELNAEDLERLRKFKNTLERITQQLKGYSRND